MKGATRRGIRIIAAILPWVAALSFFATANADDGFVLAQSTAHKLKVLADGGAGWCDAHLKLRMVLDADSPDAGSTAAQIEVMNRLKTPIVTECAAASDAKMSVFVEDKPQGCHDNIDSLGHAARLAHPAKYVNPLSASVH